MKLFDDFVEYLAKLDQRILLAVKSQEVSTYNPNDPVDKSNPMKVLIKVNDEENKKDVQLADLSEMR